MFLLKGGLYKYTPRVQKFRTALIQLSSVSWEGKFKKKDVSSVIYWGVFYILVINLLE